MAEICPRAKLTDIVAAYREYKVLDKAREEAEEIIADGSDKELAAMAHDELKELKPQLAEYEEKLKILLLPSDPNDDKNAIVEIRGGAGGEEAALFCSVCISIMPRAGTGALRLWMPTRQSWGALRK